MPHLTLAGLSDDGKRLLLVSDNGVEHTLDIDAKLRAALRGEHARLGQLEIHMDSALRPRDIQARIRAGEDPEVVAQAAQTTVDKIMAFAAPVLAERAHIAQRAQGCSLRRRAGDTGARTLGEAVAAHLRQHSVRSESVDWDAWRREDGRWTLTAAFEAGKRRGTATFAFDARGSFVTTEDDDARWLVGEAATRASTGAGDGGRKTRRLSAVPAEELPLGEDTIEMVADPEQATTEEAADLGETGLGEERPMEAYLEADPAGEEDLAEEARSVPDSAESNQAGDDTTLDVRADDDQADAHVVEDQAVEDQAADDQDEAPAEPAEEPRAPRRTTRKTRGRASVPSWDEIMFGGGKSE
jgi:hypothetical protein